jgi:gliding motility-associated-like protein
MEIALDNNLLLRTPVQVDNHLNLVFGDLISTSPLIHNYLEFTENADYDGESDISKVRGYARMTGNQNFLFPVGDEAQLRPMAIRANAPCQAASCAYFYMDATGFDHGGAQAVNSMKNNDLQWVSDKEFWHLKASRPTSVSVSWNHRSGLMALTTDIANITLAGWNVSSMQWEALTIQNKVGTIEDGFLETVDINPDMYGALTFGILDPEIYIAELEPETTNYLITPNGDGYNDRLAIKQTSGSQDCQITIFNRWGSKVYENKNYQNDFEGLSNMPGVLYDRRGGLPAGVYFYILHMKDLNTQLQGYFYLAR